VNSNQSFQFYDISGLAEHLVRGHLIITPTQRLARRIKSAWAEHQVNAGATAWATPMVMSLEHWWQQCYQDSLLAGADLSVLATPQQELEVWLQCIESNPDTPVLLRPRSAAQLARDAWHNLLLWQLDWRKGAIAQQFELIADAGLFHAWALAFERQMQKLELAALPQVLSGLVTHTQRAVIVLAEFDELPPLYRDLLQQQAGELIEYRWQGKGANCSGLVCKDKEDELRQAANWAAQILEREPRARVAVLVPDLQQRRLTVERIFRESRAGRAEMPAANISGGMPLASCPPVRAALQLLELVQAEMSLSDLVRLLHSRYRGARDADLEQALIRKLYELGNETVNASRLRQEVELLASRSERQSELGRQLLGLSQRRELRRKHLPSAWSQIFLEVLEMFGWPGAGTLDSIECQQIEHLYRALEQMSELDSVCAVLSYEEAQQRLRQFCLSAVFQSQTADSPIQVLGILEAAGLQFSHLWLTGMSNNMWPAPPSPSPFIPLSLQKRHKMPHASAERELQYAAVLLDHYQQTTRQLVASFAQLDDGVPQLPSSLVSQWFEGEEGEQLAGWPSAWSSALDAATREQVDSQPAPLVIVGGDSAHGGSGLIADQSDCPFRAFAHHRLRTRALPETGVALSHSDRGELLHDALYAFWSRVHDSRGLKELSSTQRDQLLTESIDEALAILRKHKHYAVAETLLVVESRRLHQLLQQWLTIEAGRPPFEVIAREEKCELQVGELRLSLRIDRIDRLTNGR